MIRRLLVTGLVLLITMESMAQSTLWTGLVDQDFFNELNWVIEGTQDSPPAGSIDPGVPIGLNLVINSKTVTLPSNMSLTFEIDNGLKLIDGSLELDSFSSGYIWLADRGTLILRSPDPLGNDATLQLDDHLSWIKLTKVGASDAIIQLPKISSNGNPVILDVGILTNQYYYDGSLLRLKNTTQPALTLYDGTGQTGDSFGVVPYQVFSRSQLGAFENKASSFRLERGYQAVVAIFQNGTGISKTYIASEEPLEIDLPAALDNTISFVRVMPWNWVTKKGAASFKNIGNTWTYNWNNNAASLPEMEYAPMAWGSGGASLAAVANYLEMEKVTHVLGFNESDNCNGQSGQYNNLCDVNVAVPLFENLMRTGLRLVSPSPRENGPFTWMKDFRDLAVEKNIRYDVLGVHWYDWGSNPSDSPFEDPVKVFNRFKTYLTNVYALHKMPIWITEFNANPNRDVSIHKAFLELALPYLESLDYVERYDFFVPMKENAGNRTDIEFATFYDEQGNITPFGEFYRDFVSTPSMASATLNGLDFLPEINSGISLTMTASKTTLTEGESLTLTFTTGRPVGAVESFSIHVDLEDEQYNLSQIKVTIPEGGNTAQVTLESVDDQLAEELLNATISLTDVSNGLIWDAQVVNISMSSDDVEVITSIESQSNPLQVFPNPTRGSVKIEALHEIKDVTLFTTAGLIIMEMKMEQNTLNLQRIPAGVYILQLHFKNGQVLNKRVVKN